MVLETPKPVGQTRDAGFQIGVRRTFAIDYQEAWQRLTSPAGLQLWLGTTLPSLTKGCRYQLADGTNGELRVISPDSHLRLTWHPPGWSRPSTIQVRVVPKGNKTIVAFHQEQLPGPEEREVRRAFYRQVLDALFPHLN